MTAIIIIAIIIGVIVAIFLLFAYLEGKFEGMWPRIKEWFVKYWQHLVYTSLAIGFIVFVVFAFTLMHKSDLKQAQLRKQEMLLICGHCPDDEQMNCAVHRWTPLYIMEHCAPKDKDNKP